MHFAQLILLPFALLSFFFPTGNDWELKKNEEGIKIYTREVQNSNIKEFKAVGVLNAPAEKLVSILRDADNYEDWMENMKISTLMKRESSNKQYVYHEINMPWPFDNRDMILFQEYNTNSNGETYVKVSSKHDYTAEKDGIVRMKITEGSWRFTPMGDAQTKVVYQFLGDPEGNIPAWVVNLFLVDAPFTTLKNMNKQAKK